MSYQIRCTWAAQHKMILRCTVWCFGKHSDVDPILDRKTILRWSCFDSFEKRAPGTGCSVAWESRDAVSVSYVIVIFITCFLLPLAVITFSYYKLLKAIRKVCHVAKHF